MRSKEIIGGTFPVGFLYDLHEDFSINFQMNRIYNWSNDKSIVEDMRKVSNKIRSYKDLIRIFTVLAEEALNKNNKLKAAYYFRIAEFYIFDNIEEKNKYRRKFIKLINEHFSIEKENHFDVPYEGKFLSTYKFETENPKGTVVLFGGYDSYIEELHPLAKVINLEGYNVIAFEGPGQGRTLEEYNIPLTNQWEKPVKVILDFFNVKEVILVGLSLGGNLVIRAAAFEERVKYVIADDICSNLYEVVTRQFPENIKNIIEDCLSNNEEKKISEILEQAKKNNFMLQWAINQGMRIMGANSPYEFIKKSMDYDTKEISEKLKQDVLLMAGQNDHYIPLEQFWNQGEYLTNVKSLTMRLFTKEESAENHCQLGNLGLSLEVIFNWLDNVMKSK